MKNTKKTTAHIDTCYAWSDYLKNYHKKHIEEPNIPDDGSEENEIKLEMIPRNYDLIQQTLKQYEPSDKLKTLVEKQEGAVDAYIIMEDWCPSSTGYAPYIVKILQELPDHTLYIVPRDANKKFMSHYLTDGKESIPKLVILDKDGSELFTWGPSSTKESKVSEEIKKKNPDKADFEKAMEKWYKENNPAAIEEDMIKLFSKT